MEFPFQSLIPFLTLFCDCQFWRLDSIQLLCSQAHILAGWRIETQLFIERPQLNSSLYHFAGTKQKTQPLYCWYGVFTAPLHSNGNYLIVACVFVVAGKCLPRSCLAMGVSSDFTIQAFGRHVTLLNISGRKLNQGYIFLNPKDVQLMQFFQVFFCLFNYSTAQRPVMK
jgi:hypothetical protein